MANFACVQKPTVYSIRVGLASQQAVARFDAILPAHADAAGTARGNPSVRLNPPAFYLGRRHAFHLV